MRVALCISGDFRPASNVIAAAAQHILPTESIDVFASLWTPPEVGETELRAWMSAQMNARMKLRRWTFAPVREMEGWEKFSIKETAKGMVQEIERTQYAMQQVSQLKAEQERLDKRDYDAVVRIEAATNLIFAPPLSEFLPVLDDHIVMGCLGVMPEWPVYDFRVMIMSSRNMEVCAALQTLHRRQYALRSTVFKMEKVLVEHFRHAQIKRMSVPINYTKCPA